MKTRGGSLVVGIVSLASFLLPQAEYTDSWGAATGESQVKGWAQKDYAPTESQTVEAATGPQPKYVRAPICLAWFAEGDESLLMTPEFYGAVPGCGSGSEIDIPLDYCPDGEAVQNPLWVSEPVSDTAYGPWRRLTAYTCESDPVHVAAIEAWRSMQIEPSTYTWWPGEGWTTTSWGLYPTVDDTAQTLTVDLAGTSVVLRATPIRWVWTDSDGTSHRMKRPDSMNADTAPVTFARGPERRTELSLTTTWEGHYSVDDGATWVAAPGAATTTNPPQSLHIYNPTPRLVDCDLNGKCSSGMQAPTGPVPTMTDPDADGTDNYTVPDDQIDAYLAQHAD